MVFIRKCRTVAPFCGGKIIKTIKTTHYITEVKKPMNTKLIKKNAGFSLVEMLVVIAVIGIIAAIAVPNIGRINDAADTSKDMRNAQNLASVCAAAQAANLDFVGATKELTVDAIVTGATVNDPGNPFNTTFFGVPNLSADEKTGALGYLSLSQGMLVYDATATP